MLSTRPFPLQLARMIGGFHDLTRRRLGAPVREVRLPPGPAFYPLLHGILLRLRHPVLVPPPVPDAFRAATTARVPNATLDSHRIQCKNSRQTMPDLADVKWERP